MIDDSLKSPITNVFVLMLENHSFDHIFAMSGIPGIQAATVHDSNSYVDPATGEPKTCYVQDGAPPSMTTDPGHEFEDVGQQLCGCKFPSLPVNPYPAVNNSGFACSYATSISEDTGRPAPGHVCDIMACFHTETQLPVIYQLAREFAICDNWFSSMPGPTWPNRFFVHGASSAGLDRSPNFEEELQWETYDGFQFEHGSIFDALKPNQWRLYNDYHNRFSDQPSSWEDGGWISQVASLKNLDILDVHPLASVFSDHPAGRFVNDLQGDYPYPYTFIEPNFGRSFGKPLTYKGGSSQHPEDDAYGGEGLVKAVYEAIRNSPLWNTSLLVIVYDEHGGFYDSVKPGCAVAPGDKTMVENLQLKTHGFDFSQYGVRVPAVIVSPLIPKGKVDHTLYDHSSILATVERLLSLPPLTKRDEAANDLRGLLTLPVPREDCPTELNAPASPIPNKPVVTEQMIADMSDHPLPESGNLIGFLTILLKTEMKGADAETRARILSEFRKIKTIGAARAYSLRMRSQIEAARKLQDEGQASC